MIWSNPKSLWEQFPLRATTLKEMVDEGLEQIEDKNNVRQKLHKKHFLSLMGE